MIAADRQAASRARQAARLRDARALADGRHHGRDPQKATELMMRVWRRRWRASRRRSPTCRRSPQGKAGDHHRAVGLPVLRREGPQGEVRPRPNELKPYFELNNMIAARSGWPSELYGLASRRSPERCPCSIPDVRVCEVKDKASGSHVGVYYRDDFARADKRSGAWASGYRGQRKSRRAGHADHVQQQQLRQGRAPVSRCSSAWTMPRRCSTSSATRCTACCGRHVSGLAGTPRDFVEFPSQVHENWVLTRDVLDRFRHYQTKAPMPQALVDKVKSARASSTRATPPWSTWPLRSSTCGCTRCRTASSTRTRSSVRRWRRSGRRGKSPCATACRSSTTCSRRDSYSAGYYSYLWSDVMVPTRGRRSRKPASRGTRRSPQKFRAIILATGNSIDRAEAYRRFRGREPDVNALLKKRGLLVP